MGGADWTSHPDVVNDFTIGLSGVVTVHGGGVNSLKFHGPTGSGYKLAAFYNNYVSTVYGSHEISFAARLASGAQHVRLGVFGMWDLSDLASSSMAYACYLEGISGPGLGLFVANGPAEAGPVIAGPNNSYSYDHWYQILLQMHFDQIGNLELRAAISDAEVHDLTSPDYTLEFPPLIIPKEQALQSGQFGFFCSSRQDNFDVYIDQLSVTSTLTSF